MEINTNRTGSIGRSDRNETVTNVSDASKKIIHVFGSQKREQGACCEKKSGASLGGFLKSLAYLPRN